MANLRKHLSIMAQVRRINKNLVSMSDQMKGPVEQTLIGQATLLAIEMRSLVAVDPQSENQVHVKDTIRVEQGRPTARKAIVIRVKAGNAATLKAGPGSKAYDRARALEFGTEKMNAQPFFFPPYRARRKDIRVACRKQLKITALKVFKK